MGNKNSIDLPTSFFSHNELEKLKKKFENSVNPISPIPYVPKFPEKIENFIVSHMKSTKDFKSYVGAIEFMIYGKSNNIFVNNLSPLNVLVDIINLPIDSLGVELPKVLFSLCNSQAKILEYITPPDSDTKSIINYFNQTFPVLASAFSRYIRAKYFDSEFSVPPFVPIPDRNIEKVLELLYYSTNKLAVISSALHKIYLSDTDGLSFNRIAASIAGYLGPMILVLKLSGNSIIGAYIGENLKDNAQISGSMDTFLYSLAGGFKTFKADYGDGGGRYIYLNSKLQKSIKFPIGLGFGGDKEDARLWIDGDINNESYVRKTCSTYEHGDILPDLSIQTKIVIVNVEVWGCGGDTALEYQQKFKKGEDVRISNARKIDKSQLANNEFNRENLLGDTFKNSQYKN